MTRRVRLFIGSFVALCLASAIHPFTGAAVQQGGPRPMPVLRLDPSRTVSTALNKGTTFHRLEVQADRVTTVFDDVTAVATRSADGAIAARVSDRSGRALGSLNVVRANRPVYALEFQSASRAPILLQGRAELEPTLEWANRQAYSLLQADDPARIAWDAQDLVRPTNRDIRVQERILEVRTDWPQGLTARARPQAGYVATTLTRQGREVGSIRWHAGPRVMAWKFPGLTSGFLDDESLAEIGGWPFRPDMAWMNIQAFAFQDFHAKLRRQTAAALAGWFDRIIGAVSPTLYAQDGCTGLHWLDSSIYRPCCDTHDICFEKYGCSKKSWLWPFGQAWQCTACNGAVAFCFVAKTQSPYYY